MEYGEINFIVYIILTQIKSDKLPTLFTSFLLGWSFVSQFAGKSVQTIQTVRSYFVFCM